MGLPINSMVDLSMAMLNNQRVNGFFMGTQSIFGAEMFYGDIVEICHRDLDMMI